MGKGREREGGREGGRERWRERIKNNVLVRASSS
jgi:hypothetical protein